ncbi:hypothetical protein PENPOL_c005G00772 [Penicillium polonicum]|uniref:Uncharacterized protein n=1 Tax=Penicillium polonicum TaxID=60169 RepID=A0A1V6NMQ5_PENPO|nr:hypothetical protein PENPOL_c005G00772 [Penicillium polonicum]
MAPLKILLDGMSSISRQPEQCALRFIVKATGPTRESVSKEVTETSNEINQLFKELSPKTEAGETIPGSPVASFSSTSLQTHCQIPTNKSGKPLPAVYHTTLSLNALFEDFTKLNEVVGKLFTYSNIEIQSLNWCLTEATQKALNSESREEAMRNAVQKANDYARVTGQEVHAVQIRESGGGVQCGINHGLNYPYAVNQLRLQQMQQHLVTQQNASPPPHLDASTFNYLDASTALDLSPQLIRYVSSVQVEFESVEG